MQGFSKILFFSLFILFIGVSCSLCWGPETDKALTITHETSELVENNGIGNDWETPIYSINGSAQENGFSYRILLSTWDELQIECRYVEWDEAYPDEGTGIFSTPVWELLSQYGNDFVLKIRTIIYERRSENPSYSGNSAIWEDVFHIEVVDPT